MERRTWLPTPCHSRASGNPGVLAGFQICPRNDKEKEWIPAFAGMTKKKQKQKKKKKKTWARRPCYGKRMDSRFRGNDKKNRKKNFMLFMCFMVTGCCMAYKTMGWV